VALTKEDISERPFTVVEAAEFLQVNANTITRWIKSGKIRAVKIGHAWRIKRSEISRILEGE
jgi:excisionase family DNA binding protein